MPHENDFRLIREIDHAQKQSERCRREGDFKTDGRWLDRCIRLTDVFLRPAQQPLREKPPAEEE